MITTVMNIRTGHTQVFPLSPAQAVVFAYEQYLGHFDATEYDYTKTRITQSGKYILMDDFCAALPIIEREAA